MSITSVVNATTTNLGLVGDRELVAVQTIDIARFTTHIAPIVPGSFVAVSGRGPKNDSNGSGKTSFQSVVTVLLGDPQWRFDINGGAPAVGLLLQAEATGIEGEFFSAERGYIIGVFARRGHHDVNSSVTVWVRLTKAKPHLVARVTPGIVVVDADTDDARYRQADELWVSLGRDGECSARRMGETLYGDAPRCLSFLDTDLRKNAPSLLSEKMTDMSPAAIGDALIELAGLRHHFDAEQEQRNKLGEHERSLREAKATHQDRLRTEEAQLEGIRGRERARGHLARGEQMWRLHFAKRLVEVVPLVTQAEEAQAAALIEKENAERDANAARDDLRAIGDGTELDAAVRAARAEQERATGEFNRISGSIEQLRGRLTEVKTRESTLIDAASGWDGSSVESAAATLKAAHGNRASVAVTRDSAVAGVAEAKRLLKEAAEGRTPETASAIDALGAAEVVCAGFADAVDLTEAARTEWEALLWHWRDAIVVRASDLPSAVTAVAGIPGTTLISADPDGSDAPPVPEGVQTTWAIGGFLSRVAQRASVHLDPVYAHDPDVGVITIGTFSTPVTGRATRIGQAQSFLRAAEQRLVDANESLIRAERAVGQCEQDEAIAKAVAELATVVGTIKRIDAEIAEKAGSRSKAQTAVDEAQSALEVAINRQAGHNAQVLTAKSRVKDCEQEVSSYKDDVERAATQILRLNLPYWQSGWGGSVEEAQEALAAQDEAVRVLKPDTIRRRASEALREAIVAYGSDGALSDDLLRIGNDDQRQRILEPDNEGVAGNAPSFVDFAMPLQIRLDGTAELDAIVGESIERERTARGQNLAMLETEVSGMASGLSTLQDMIEQSVESRFDRMRAAFDRLSREHGGFGADLVVSSRRPETADAIWRWEVTPQWRRSSGGRLTSYKVTLNGAAHKVASFHLTLAALVAGDESSKIGKVLVIDELGNSLGDVNRKDVLKVMQSVAESEGITILGVCQDSVLDDAASYSRELLWFRHASEHQVYNQPVRAWGFDEFGDRVDLIGDAVRSGRPWL